MGAENGPYRCKSADVKVAIDFYTYCQKLPINLFMINCNDYIANKHPYFSVVFLQLLGTTYKNVTLYRI